MGGFPISITEGSMNLKKNQLLLGTLTRAGFRLADKAAWWRFTGSSITARFCIMGLLLWKKKQAMAF